MAIRVAVWKDGGMSLARLMVYIWLAHAVWVVIRQCLSL